MSDDDHQRVRAALKRLLQGADATEAQAICDRIGRAIDGERVSFTLLFGQAAALGQIARLWLAKQDVSDEEKAVLANAIGLLVFKSALRSDIGPLN